MGFEAAQGKVVITMDADLQDSPDEIPALMEMITHQGFDMVSGWKKATRSFEQNITLKIFNRTVRMVSGIQLHDFNCD